MTPLIEKLRTTKSHRIREMERPRKYITIAGKQVDVTNGNAAAWQAIADVLQWGEPCTFSMTELVFRAAPGSAYDDLIKYMFRYPLEITEAEKLRLSIEYVEAYAEAYQHHHSSTGNHRPDPFRPYP